MGDIITALKHNDRIRKIELNDVPYLRLKDVAVAMPGPFPELTRVEVVNKSHVGCAQVLPDSFLSGSAPRLQFLRLGHILFPGLPKLLLSGRALIRVPPGHIHLKRWSLPFP